MNWDNITYIFQIPITWYEKIHKRVFGAYGTNFIRVKDGDDGEMQIDVDEATFKQAVQNSVGITGATLSNQKVITDVIWDGTTLKYKSRYLSFDNGLLVDYSNETATTIDTPVAYSTT